MGKIKGFLFAVRHREILMTDLGLSLSEFLNPLLVQPLALQYCFSLVEIAWQNNKMVLAETIQNVPNHGSVLNLATRPSRMPQHKEHKSTDRKTMRNYQTGYWNYPTSEKLLLQQKRSTHRQETVKATEKTLYDR